MREYHIYIIQESIASEFYGMETKLFQLFQENREAKGKLKEATDKQIAFVAGGIRKSELHTHLKQHLKNTEGYILSENKHFIMSPDRRSQSALSIYEKHLKLFSEGTQDSEACFFEALRQFHPYFIAMDFKENSYGWLKPFKTMEMAQHHKMS